MKYFLSRHKEWLKSGRVPNGLCAPIGHTSHFKCLIPTQSDIADLVYNGNKSIGFWASEMYWNNPEKAFIYTPLRQNIVLFCAAMNGEL